jgi:hypothetical protein
MKEREGSSFCLLFRYYLAYTTAVYYGYYGGPTRTLTRRLMWSRAVAADDDHSGAWTSLGTLDGLLSHPHIPSLFIPR